MKSGTQQATLTLVINYCDHYDMTLLLVKNRAAHQTIEVQYFNMAHTWFVGLDPSSLIHCSS